jgi:cyclic pyranopterin phosphate synthase
MKNKDSSLTHINKSGKAVMVDVGEKPIQKRRAIAIGSINLQSSTIELIKDDAIKKGNVLTVAEIAGIQSAKKTQELIPLCHNIFLNSIEVTAVLTEKGIEVKSVVQSIGQTGVEMEALTAVSVALLTVYDMCKAVDKKMLISNIRLLEKTKI